MDYLSKLENQSIYILREAFNKFENLAMLWSIGKDSTVLLWLARKAFFGHVPFPLVHVDTTYKIPVHDRVPGPAGEGMEPAAGGRQERGGAARAAAPIPTARPPAWSAAARSRKTR